ncbi:hypothetical protein [Marinivivus vitaminiproducens]|uniref:hypothetical protein n=1 Tax=Marinivivus vitaminiproducens TaxID=3035935 RepID=UPI002798D4C7|nr:hypothetical protein P4R82_11935 [Geminicoccaceae bacterium SCSIO 64248]
MRTLFVTILAFLLFGASMATAQSYTQVRDEDAEGFELAEGFTLEDLDDASVVDASGAELGEVEYLLADDVGEINAVVVEMEGDRDVIVELAHLEPGDDGKLTSDLSAERMAEMPRYQAE